MKELRDGTILLYRSGKGFISKAIAYFTGMPYAHVSGYIQGFTFTSSVWWSGLWFKSGIYISIGAREADEYWQPIRELTPGEKLAILRYFIDSVNKRRPYNFGKFLVLAIVYPTRRFWEKIGWVPFSAAFFGDVCSIVWDEAYKGANWDLLPRQSEEYTVPGDIRKSKLLEKVEA